MELPPLDLLIRSTSSLLSIVHPQAADSQKYDDDDSRSSPDQRHLTLLDRLALLFVTHPSSDVAAVAAAFTLDGVWLFDTKTDPVPPDHEDVLLFTKNSSTDKTSEKHVPYLLVPGKTRAGTQWKKTCLKHGPHDAPTYAAQLQFLIAQVMKAKKENKDIAPSITEIYHYVYFQCIPKLRQRLFLPIAPGNSTPFYELFINDESVNLADLSTRFCPFENHAAVSLRLLNTDETQLKNEIEQQLDITVPTYTWKNPETSKQIHHIQLDGEMCITLFAYLRNAVQVLVDSVNSVMALRRTFKQKDLSEKAISQLTDSLGYVARSMDAFSTLSNHSLATWTLLQQPAIVEAFGKAIRRNPEPTDTVHGEPEVEGDADDRQDEEMTDIQYEALSSPALAIRHWMRCVSQWDLALREFRRGSLEKFIFSQSLQIATIKTPPVLESRRQASLRDTLLALSGFSELESAENAEKLLCTLAKEKLNVSDPHGRANQVSQRGGNKEDVWRLLATGDEEDGWRNSFTGKTHCETVLASLMELDVSGEVEFDPEFVHLVNQIKRSSKFIGVSKRCCYTCMIFLKALNPNIKHAACHGKVYPWAIPSWYVPVDVKRKVLDALQSKLIEFLLSEQSARRRISSDTGSGSESETMAGVQLSDHADSINRGYSNSFKLTHEKMQRKKEERQADVSCSSPQTTNFK